MTKPTNRNVVGKHDVTHVAIDTAGDQNVIEHGYEEIHDLRKWLSRLDRQTIVDAMHNDALVIYEVGARLVPQEPTEIQFDIEVYSDE